jgi:hypothetical protein
MGGAYFLKPNDYSRVDSTTGVRLGNPESAYIQKLKAIIQQIGKNGKTDTQMMRKTFQWIKQLNSEKKRAVVYGSTYDKETWQDLSLSMRRRRIPSFDLVICRPEGPFFESFITDDVPLTDRQKLKYAAVFDKVFREVLERVNQQHGLLFFQIPEIFDRAWIDAWTKKIAARYNLEIHLWTDLRFNALTGRNAHSFAARFKN